MAIKEQDIDMLKMRYVDKVTLQHIGDKFNMTREGARQRIRDTINLLGWESEGEEWKSKHNADEGENSGLIRLSYMMGTKHRANLRRIIDEYGIKSLDDFVLVPKKGIKTRRCGPVFINKLKLCLLKLGVAYSEKDNFETLERESEKIKSRNHTSGINLRFKIMDRDGFKCQYCGRSPRTDNSVVLHVDHIKPISKGGSWDERNLITACNECNLGKADKIVIIEN